jgi:hypothetical protein
MSHDDLINAIIGVLVLWAVIFIPIRVIRWRMDRKGIKFHRHHYRLSTFMWPHYVCTKDNCEKVSGRVPAWPWSVDVTNNRNEDDYA